MIYSRPIYVLYMSDMTFDFRGLYEAIITQLNIEYMMYITVLLAMKDNPYSSSGNGWSSKSHSYNHRFTGNRNSIISPKHNAFFKVIYTYIKLNMNRKCQTIFPLNLHKYKIYKY